MKLYLLVPLMLCGVMSNVSFLRASCTTFSQVSGSPFATGSSPNTMAYSAVLNNSSFALVPNGNGGVTVYNTNTTTGALTQVAGSPFSAGSGPYGGAFSPIVGGNLFAAVTNSSTTTVSVYQVNMTTGAFTQVTGSPFTTVSTPLSVAYSPVVGGNLFAAIVSFTPGGGVAVFQVNTTTGVFTSVTGSPFSTGNGPNSVAFSPVVGGNLFAALTNSNSNTVSVYQVNTTTGVFTAVTGSPFATGNLPHGVAFTPVLSGNLFAAVANYTDGTVSVYQVNTTTGVFTQIAGSPFATGSEAYNVAISSLIGGNLYAAVPSYNGTTASVYLVNTTTGAFTLISTIAVGTTHPANCEFSPLVNGNMFLSTVNQGNNTVSVYQVQALLPIITTPSQIVTPGSTVAINATILNGTSPYTVVWSDGYTQSGVGNSVTRLVSPKVTTTYQITKVTDANSCTAGPSNSITLTMAPVYIIGTSTKLPAVTTTFFGDQDGEDRDDHLAEQFEYGIQSLRVTSASASSGFVTTLDSMAKVSTGTTSGSTASIQSARYIRYQPGRQGYALFSALFTSGVAGTTQWMGCFDAIDGFAVGYNGTAFSILYRSSASGAVVNTIIPQSSFNVDQLNGTGPSGITLNPQDMNIFRIQYSWLGISPVQFSVLNNKGQFKVFHIIQLPNSITIPALLLPQLAMRAEVDNPSASSNVSVSTGGWSGGMVDTYRNPANGRFFMVSNTLGSLSTGAATHVLTIQNPSTVGGLTNKIEAKICMLGGGSVDISGSTFNTSWQLLLNATVTGTSFSAVNTGNSIMNVSTTGTYTAGTGTLVLTPSASGFGGGLTPTFFNTRDDVVDVVILPGQIMTLVASTTLATTHPVIGFLGWDERY